MNVSLVQKMHISLITKLLSQPLKISHIPGIRTRWLKKRPAFVLKSCGHKQILQWAKQDLLKCVTFLLP